MLFRNFKWKFPSVAQSWVGPIIILFMIIVGSITFYALTLWAPKYEPMRPRENQSADTIEHNMVGEKILLPPNRQFPGSSVADEKQGVPKVFGSRTAHPNEQRVAQDTISTSKEQAQGVAQIIIDRKTMSYHTPKLIYFAPMSDFIVMSHEFGNSGIYAIWNTSSAQLVSRTYYDSFRPIIPRHRFAVAPEGLFYASSDEKSIVVNRLEFDVSNKDIVAMSPYGLLIFDATLGTIRLKQARADFTALTRKDIGKPVAEIPVQGYRQDFALSPGVEYVAVGYQGKTSIYSTRTRAELAVVEESGYQRTFQDYYMKFSPSSQYFAYITAKSNIHSPGPTSVVIVEVGSWRELGRFSIEGQEIYQFAFSDDNKNLITAAGGGRLIAWNLETGNQVVEFENPGDFRGRYVSTAISPDGKYVIASREGWMSTTTSYRRYGVVDFWSMEKGRYLFSLDIRRNGFIAYLPEEKFYFSKGSKEHVSVGYNLESYPLTVYEKKYPEALDSLDIIVSHDYLAGLLR